MIEAILVAAACGLLTLAGLRLNDLANRRAEQATAKAKADMGRLIYAGYHWDIYEFGVVDNFTGMRLYTPRDNGEWMDG